MHLDRCLVLGLALAASLAQAQLLTVDADWREVEAPPPPALNLDGLIPFEIPRSALRFGVAPASVTLGSDGIVRYVVVATSDSGTVNGLYEGIRCSTGEHKVYARHNPGSGWVVARNGQWQAVQQVRHGLMIARSGVCVGHAPNQSVTKILSDLRSPTGRFDQP
jgi:hypothetical protein